MTLTGAMPNWLLPAYLATCLIVGGASGAGIFANAGLQLLAIVVITWCLLRQRHGLESGSIPGRRGLLALALITLAIPLTHLIPLPMNVWQALPGRAQMARIDLMFGLSEHWRPLSLQPLQTLNVLLGLLPPLAALLLTLRSTEVARRRAVLVIIATGVVSADVGALQILGGPGNVLYFYEFTNDNTSVGFFANSNHLSTLFLMALVFSADLPLTRPRANAAGAWLLARWGLMGFFVANLLLNRSIAGIILMVPALAFWLARTERVKLWMAHSWRRVATASILIGGISFGAIAYGWHTVGLQRLAAGMTDPSERYEFLQRTLAIADDYSPAGAGWGTFRALYAAHEDPATVTTTYVNHAHNDYAELYLELGLLAPMLLVAFGLWFAMQLRRLNRSGETVPKYAPAAAMSIVLVAAHSLVDYPLRTAALGAATAMCLAMLMASYGATKARSSPRPGEADSVDTNAAANASK